MFEEFLVKLIPWIIPLILIASFVANHAIPTNTGKKDAGKSKSSKSKPSEDSAEPSQDVE